jgi:predicted amidohydrolase
MAPLQSRRDLYMRDFLRAAKLPDDEIERYVRDAYERCRGAIRRAFALGVPVAIGSDAAHTFPSFDVVREMESFQELGIPTLDVMSCATGVSAQATEQPTWGPLSRARHRTSSLLAAILRQTSGVLRDKSRVVMMLQDGRVITNTLN